MCCVLQVGAAAPIFTDGKTLIALLPEIDGLRSPTDGLRFPERLMLMSNWMKELIPTDYPGIWRTKTGFRVRVRAVDSRTGMRKEANRTYEGIKLTDAVKLQVELREELLAHGPRTARTRVGEFARLWIESKGAVVTEDTLQGYGYALEDHILPVVGNMFYDAIGHLEVQAMVAAWKGKKKRNGKPYSYESMKDWFRIFRNMTHDAMVQLELHQDPTLRISLGEDSRSDAGAEQQPSIADCLAVLDAMKRKRPGSFALLHTKACTGQRFCHVSALQWGDLDLEGRSVRFRRKQVRGAVGPISKKKPTPREVPLLAELAETLSMHKVRMEKLGYPTDVGDWVFPTRNGKLKEPSSLTNAIASSSKEAKVTTRVTPHQMRYMFNDLLRQAQVDKVTRKAMVGHVTDQMQDHYSTVLLAERREAMVLVEAKLLEMRQGGGAGL